MSTLLNDTPYVLENRDGEDENKEALVRDFDCDSTQGAEDLLGFNKDGLEDNAKEDEWNLADDGKSLQEIPNRHHVAATVRSEGNHCRGGVKIQKSTIKIWNLFFAEEKASGRVHDDIVDEHSLLQSITWSGDHPKLNCQGEYIPGT
ncbi:hypothetical protein PILCRDRAFT_15149 [Piloderma croceum F 1598]|uniref:Uncharacterized protein n=1 Tax=Piloderma croceum (strain F 1598) TaxID=765440 RepID=A0A0C3F086_PILCF|nr:hypothetical protein PILCRDRAFT_15149 [Piloderma croceum F 1598]